MTERKAKTIKYGETYRELRPIRGQRSRAKSRPRGGTLSGTDWSDSSLAPAKSDGAPPGMEYVTVTHIPPTEDPVTATKDEPKRELELAEHMTMQDRFKKIMED